MSRASATEILEAAATAMAGGPCMFPAPWPHRLGVVELAVGSRIFVEVAESLTITELPDREVIDRIVRWMRLHQNPEWILDVRKAGIAAEMFRSIADPIPLAGIRTVRWATERGYAWHRLPWDAAEGATPTWDAMLARMTNRDAFCAFIGSLFFDESSRHNYVWMHGAGGDGKGAINRFLADIFGRAYRSKQPPGHGDRFWTYGLIGTRLVVFPDCNSRGFVAGGLFKSLTGGDPVDVEAKCKMSFTTRLNCKFVFFSNEQPTLSAEAADMRRIIHCEFTEPPPPATHDFEAKLWAEGGAFLGRCAATYVAMCPHHEAIQASHDLIKDWVSQLDERFEILFEKHFAKSAATSLNGKSRSVVDAMSLTPQKLEELLKQDGLNQTECKEFRLWMTRTHGIKKRSVELDDGQVVKRYVGVRWNRTFPYAVVSSPSREDTLTP